jgi:iron-sulfur cluster assembly accessory protein
METEQIQPSLVLTESAAARVKELLEKHGKTGYGFRVFVRGGGCSGFTYGLSLEKDPMSTDYVLEQYGIRVYVDKYSYELIKGSTIDYVETIQASGFKIDNPNAVQSCGCGQSFRTTAKPGTVKKCN